MLIFPYVCFWGSVLLAVGSALYAYKIAKKSTKLKKELEKEKAAHIRAA